VFKVVSKILRTDTAIYTAVVVARSTGPNRPNCEFWVLLQHFAATAWKRAKTSPCTLARTDLAASPWQRPGSHFCLRPAVSGQVQNGCHPPPTILPWFGTLWLLLFPKTNFLFPKTTSRKCSRNGGESGTSVYMQEGTTSRVMVADRSYGEFYDF
jgi:hypothetical protein